MMISDTSGKEVCVRAGFYTPDPEYDFHELCNEADHRLFNTILQSEYHVLEQLLPPTNSHSNNKSMNDCMCHLQTHNIEHFVCSPHT